MAKQNRLLDIKTVRLNKLGLNVRYTELWDSTHPLVLLLHGVLENLQGWYAVAPLLAEKYHVLALDWPGFGGSDPLTSPEGYTSRRFAEVIVDCPSSDDLGQVSECHNGGSGVMVVDVKRLGVGAPSVVFRRSGF